MTPGLPLAQLIGRGLGEAGPTITLTSVTDFVAFLVGTTTVIPAIRAFCIFAAVTIFIDFILQVMKTEPEPEPEHEPKPEP